MQLPATFLLRPLTHSNNRWTSDGPNICLSTRTNIKSSSWVQRWLSGQASELVDREVASLTLLCASVDPVTGVTAWAASNCDGQTVYSPWRCLRQLSLPSLQGWQMRTSFTWEGKDRYGSFHSWINACENCESPRQRVPYLSTSAVRFLHWRVLYQVYDLYLYLLFMINVWATGKSVWSLDNACHAKAFL